MKQTKADLQGEVERLKSEKVDLQKVLKSIKWEFEDEQKRLTQLIRQDNALLDLLNEIL